MNFVSKRIKVYDYDIHYLEWPANSESAQTIFCVHGYPGSSLDFTRLVKYLKGDYRIISIDLLGSGVSDSPPGVQFPITMHADYLIEMIRVLRVESSILVGHSYGGAICQIAASKAPEFFKCLLLLASIGSVPHISHRKFKPGFVLTYYLLKIPKFYSLIRPLVVYGFRKLKLSEKMVENEDRLKVFYKTVIDLNFKEIGEYASGIVCPTLYISCSDDRLVDPVVRKDLERKIKYFQYAELQGRSHFLQHTHTVHVKEIVLQFLNQVSGNTIAYLN